MKLIVVPHGPKLAGLGSFPAELASDPPMTMEGKAKMLALVPTLRALGPYIAVYCSLMDRACGSMCTIANALNIQRVTCISELGQRANLDADGTIVRYPGYESEDNPAAWQSQGLQAVKFMRDRLPSGGFLCPEFYLSEHYRKSVLVFTHRPILAGLIATAKGIKDPDEIQKILDDKETVGKGFRVFQRLPDGTIEVLE